MPFKFARFALAPPFLTLLARPWAGYGVAITAVSIAVLLRAGLETVGHFYYLPMVPAVVATAAVAGRKATALAILLSITANALLVERESPLDAIANAVLFALVTWLTAELCWGLRAYRQRTGELSRNLAHREEMLETILASAPVVVLDRSGRIRFISPFACTLLGIAEDAAIGEPFRTFVDEFDIGAFHTGEEALAGETDRVWTCRRGSETFPLGIQLGLMPGSYAHSHAVLCLADLTQAHQADERARALHLQLSRVWRLNSLGEMAASLAHELNQPLTAAATYLEAGQVDLRRAGPIGENASRTIGLAKSQLLRAGEIIRHMRELLAHESRSLAVERVSSMVADLRSVFAMIERSEHVRIDIRVDDLTDRVRAERIQFQQAMLNLVRNAADALVGRTDARIVIVGQALSADRYEVRVEDNGAGIPPDELETIFRPMVTTKTGGMGLGLSVTRTIVESHGGVLQVESSAMGGAAFSFSLMREGAPEDA